MLRRPILCLALACSSQAPAPSPPPPSPCVRPSEPFQTGEATHYAADGTGSCSFDRKHPASGSARVGSTEAASGGSDDAGSAGPLLVAAINDADYQQSARCGSCLVVVGPEDRDVLVEVVDRCPGCKPGDLDLSRDAFALLAPLARGRIPIRWQPVPCNVKNPLVYHFKPGSSGDWAGIQVRNHRYPIAGLDVRDARGTFTPLPRADYNYFIGKGLGPGPYTLRVTDARGQMHVEAGVALGGDHTGSAQLPRCP